MAVDIELLLDRSLLFINDRSIQVSALKPDGLRLKIIKFMMFFGSLIIRSVPAFCFIGMPA